MMKPRIDFRSPFSVAGSLLLLVLASCASTPPQYDATTDADISNLQKEVDSQLVQWITYDRIKDAASLEKGSYQANVAFYAKVDSDLSALELRMEAVPDESTKKLPQFFSNLQQQFMNLQNAHQAEKNLKEVVLVPIRNQMNAQFAVLLTYELSLRGVSSPKQSSTESTSTATAASKVAGH
jgi:hypothetical protein